MRRADPPARRGHRGPDLAPSDEAMMFTWSGAREHFLWRPKDRTSTARGKAASTPTAVASAQGGPPPPRDGVKVPCAPPLVLCEEIVDCDW